MQEQVIAAFDLFDALLKRGDAGEAPTGGPYRLTAAFLRRDGRWLWHTYSGSEPVD